MLILLDRLTMLISATNPIPKETSIALRSSVLVKFICNFMIPIHFNYTRVLLSTEPNLRVFTVSDKGRTEKSFPDFDDQGSRSRRVEGCGL